MIGAAAATRLRWPSTLQTMHEHEHHQPRSDAETQATEWDARYSERDGAMWSGRPNGRLVAEVAGFTTGRALDVGCGEGADAIWLARSGWAVTAIDISDVALARAREAARLAGVAVDWVRGDALQAPFAAGSFDLEPRIDPPHGSPHIADVVLRARRRAQARLRR